MELSSLVEQINTSPELWGAFRWTVAGMAAVIGYLWYHIERTITKRLETIEDIIDKLGQSITELEKEVIKDYVSYVVFNKVMDGFKDEVHNGMRDVKEELASINKYLREGK